jgi:CRISPR-associated endoribonuclease Cas6
MMTLMEKLRRFVGRTLGIGEMIFILEGFEPLEPRIPEGYGECVISAGTPIVIRIPRYRCGEYTITPERDYAYVYWRKEYTPTAFIKQLEDNLAKKYMEYSGMKVESFPLFERLRFRKQVAVPLQMRSEETTVIGTLWDFHIQALNDLKRDILQFGLDAGLGEMNSLGFGFVNLHEQGRFHGKNS